MSLVVYGDFNCPYSALASYRVDALLARSIDIEWRAVEHKPEIPPEGERVEGELRDEIAHEVAEVNELVAPDEPFLLSVPRRRPNTRAHVETFSSYRGDTAHHLRRGIFATVWDLSAQPIDRGSDHPPLAREWREQWLGFDDQVVPTLVLSDGTVLPGRDALARLADLWASRS